MRTSVRPFKHRAHGLTNETGDLLVSTEIARWAPGDDGTGARTDDFDARRDVVEGADHRFERACFTGLITFVKLQVCTSGLGHSTPQPSHDAMLAGTRRRRHNSVGVDDGHRLSERYTCSYNRPIGTPGNKCPHGDDHESALRSEGRCFDGDEFRPAQRTRQQHVGRSAVEPMLLVRRRSPSPDETATPHGRTRAPTIYFRQPQAARLPLWASGHWCTPAPTLVPAAAPKGAGPQHHGPGDGVPPTRCRRRRRARQLQHSMTTAQGQRPALAGGQPPLLRQPQDQGPDRQPRQPTNQPLRQPLRRPMPMRSIPNQQLTPLSRAANLQGKDWSTHREVAMFVPGPAPSERPGH